LLFTLKQNLNIPWNIYAYPKIKKSKGLKGKKYEVLGE
jgi:hypothetical protein